MIKDQQHIGADPIEQIATAIAPLRQALREHKLYRLLTDIGDIRIFMEQHVYAVWDFMSLLKALQMRLTCVTLPWRPVANPRIARFINEIVWGEESDVNEIGEPKSHFEMYLEAMQELKADPTAILQFTARLDGVADTLRQLKQAPIPPAARDFLTFTFGVIAGEESHRIASAFTFGREDLIPDMFIAIIRESSDGGVNRFPKLTYYLERHIEVDGDDHGPLALEMMRELCGNDAQKWQDALETAREALQYRIQLWDAIAADIEARKQ